MNSITTLAAYKAALFDALGTSLLPDVETLEQFQRHAEAYTDYLRDNCDFTVTATPAPRTVKAWFAEYMAKRATYA